MEVPDETTENETPDLGIDDVETVETEPNQDEFSDELELELELEEDIVETEAEENALTE